MADAFQPMSLFSFPLFATVLDGHEAHDGALRSLILDFAKSHPGRVRSNRNAWHSGDEFAQSRDLHIAWVLQQVTAYATKALASSYQDWAAHELGLVGYWANVLGPGGWNAPHHHIPTHWSGVYYVAVGPVGNGKDDFSGMIEFLNPNPYQSVLGKWGGSFLYGPREGLVLLFPASVLHFVHPHASEKPRVSIAFNLNVVPKAR